MKFLSEKPATKPAILLPLAMCVGMLSACTTVIPSQPSQFEFNDVFQAESDSEAMPVDWWTQFSDAELNAWMTLALERNFSLQAAQARLDQARAGLRGSRSDYYPSLEASLGKKRSWNADDTTATAWSGGLSTSYEIDIWGSIRAASNQSFMNLQASSAAYRTVANTIAGDVTTAWLGLRMQAENLELLNDQRQRLQTALEVIEGRKKRGQAKLSDVWQQQKLLESLQVDILSAEAQRDIYIQQLAVWTGQGRSDLTPEKVAALGKLPEISGEIIALPVAVIQARPDVEQAWFALQAASAGVAIAESNRYPRLTLSASYSGEDPEFSQIFDNWVANLAGSLVLPLIDGGQRRAEVQRQRALETEAVAEYSRTLLEAAQEVQEALVQESRYARTAASLYGQLDLARRTLELQDYYYARGQLDFLELLNAQQELLNLESQYLAARWNHVQARIQVYKSVSHGQFGDTE